MNLTELANKNLVPQIRQRMLFLDHFEEPKDFYTMSAVDRILIMQRYVDRQVEATTDNLWVWFGPYAQKDCMPIFNNTRVIRNIYETIIGPLRNPRTDKPGRLINSLVEKYCDVNPYKYLPAQGKKYMTPARYANTIGIDVDHAQRVHAKKALEPQLIQAATNRIIEFIDDFHTIDQIKFMLNALGMTDDQAEKAIHKFKEKYHDQFASKYPNLWDIDTTGISQSPQVGTSAGDGDTPVIVPSDGSET